jgi:hypothetical protein
MPQFQLHPALVLAASDPLVAPTWATAIATIVLAVGAIVTAALAFLAFRGQARELTILQSQAKDDREDRLREATERRRERASMVYMTVAFDNGVHRKPDGAEIVGNPSLTATVHNSGRQPVYDVRLHWVDADSEAQAGAEDVLGTISPLNKVNADRTLPQGSGKPPLIPVAHFRDAAGVQWTLLDDGEFDEADPTYSAGAPIIATSAVARSRKRAEYEARLSAAITALENNDLAGAQRVLDLRKRIDG